MTSKAAQPEQDATFTPAERRTGFKANALRDPADIRSAREDISPARILHAYLEETLEDDARAARLPIGQRVICIIALLVGLWSAVGASVTWLVH